MLQPLLDAGEGLGQVSRVGGVGCVCVCVKDSCPLHSPQNTST